MKLLAFDQSTKKTGWAVFQDGVFAGCGLLDYSKDLNPSTRFVDMCKAVSGIIESEKPDFVVFEGVTYQRNAATLIELAQLQGVMIAACLSDQIEFYIYPPSSWRKALGMQQGAGVKREVLKRQAMDYVRDVYQLEQTEDVAEAICIAAAFITLK